MKFKTPEILKDSEYKNNKEISLFYFKNRESLKGKTLSHMDFGQDIEPTGDYIGVSIQNFNSHVEKFEYGVISFKNPLFLDFKSTNSSGWKKDLSEMFGGKTGKKLNKAIKEAGYDGIITVEEYRGKISFNESVNINSIRQPLSIQKEESITSKPKPKKFKM